MCDTERIVPGTLPIATGRGPELLGLPGRGIGLQAQTTPTRFGSFLKMLPTFVDAALTGAAFGGGDDPLSQLGIGYLTARNQIAQRQKLARQQLMEDLLFKRELRKPLFQPGAPIRARRAGADVFMQRNLETGEFEPIAGFQPPPEKSTERLLTEGALAGHILTEPGSTLRPGVLERTLPMPALPGISGIIPPKPAQEVSIPQSLPEMFRAEAEKKDSRPKPQLTTERDAKGIEQSFFVDANPDSPTFGHRMKQPVATRQPLPERARQTAAQAEEAAAEALRLSGNDPERAVALVNQSDMDPAAKSAIRQRIRERVRPGESATARREKRRAEARAKALAGVK